MGLNSGGSLLRILEQFLFDLSIMFFVLFFWGRLFGFILDLGLLLRLFGLLLGFLWLCCLKNDICFSIYIYIYLTCLPVRQHTPCIYPGMKDIYHLHFLLLVFLIAFLTLLFFFLSDEDEDELDESDSSKLWYSLSSSSS